MTAGVWDLKAVKIGQHALRKERDELVKREAELELELATCQAQIARLDERLPLYESEVRKFTEKVEQ